MNLVLVGKIKNIKGYSNLESTLHQVRDVFKVVSCGQETDTKNYTYSADTCCNNPELLS